MTLASRTEVRVVDDRTFLLGLDQLYRDAVRIHERDELLKCARAVCEVLGVEPADVPVEGYYSEEAELTDYFLRVRALQNVDSSERPRVDTLPAISTDATYSLVVHEFWNHDLWTTERFRKSRFSREALP